MQPTDHWGKAPPPTRTVDELVSQLKQHLEPAFRYVVVEGEVVNASVSTGGHVYFSLRGARSSIKAVMFRTALAQLPRPPRNGDLVTLAGDVQIYDRSGNMQLVAQWLRQSGEGELLVQLEALKRRLEAEGLFDQTLKKRLPFLPRRIGLVTSRTGAAVVDMLRSIHSRFPVPVLLAPVAVQGADAAPRMINALNAVAAFEHVDVIVLGRGGGSLQDLWAFNDERLARAIAACPKPIVSAVGHEVDNVLTDFVADARAATPTAVGELVVPNAAELREFVTRQRQGAAIGLTRTVRHARTRLTGLTARIRDPRRLVQDRMLRVDALDHRLRQALRSRLDSDRQRIAGLEARARALHPSHGIQRGKERLSELTRRLVAAIALEGARGRQRLDRSLGRLTAYSPRGVLARGYAIVRRASDQVVVRSRDDAAMGARVELLLADGKLNAHIAHADVEADES